MAQVAHEEDGRGVVLSGLSVPSQTLAIFVVAIDITTLILASVLASEIYQYYLHGKFSPQNNAVGVGVLTAIFFLLLSRSQGLYRLDAILEPTQRNVKILLAFGSSLLAVTCILFLLKSGADFSRGSVLIFALLAAVSLPLGRAFSAHCARLGVARGVVRGRPIVTIGDPSELERLHPDDFLRFGVDEIARIAVGARNARGGDLGRATQEQVTRAIAIARNQRALGFALVMPWSRDRELAEITGLLRMSPLPVCLFPDHRVRGILAKQKQSNIDPYFSVTVQREPLNLRERILKRSVDCILATAALAVFSPLLACVAAAIKFDSPGPVIFRQRRQGFDGREFVIFKFRTMKVLEDGDCVTQATRDDDRVTRVGRILRRSSIDELPQLWNVIRGDMSLVGPRPHALAHDQEYGARIATYAMRHHVKPGLTGAAQVTGLRGETRELSQMEQRVERDVWYINNWSLTLDLKIMALTCSAMLKDDAY